jgi:sporulation protein YlmC with PRC-barrel domain
MRARALRGMRVVDGNGADIGILEDLDMKRTGHYALIVKGEAHALSAKAFKEKLGIAGLGKDFFEIYQEHISSIDTKIHLNKPMEEIQNIVVLSSQE